MAAFDNNQNVSSEGEAFAPPPPSQFPPPPPPQATLAPTVPPLIHDIPKEQTVVQPEPVPPQPAQPVVQSSESVVSAAPPKRGFPKMIILAVLIIILFAVGAFFVAQRFLGGGLLGDKKVELTWWGLWEDQGIVAPLIAEYQEANPNVTINYVASSKEDYRERLTNSLARGAGPDIFRIHNTWVPMFQGELSTLPASVMPQQEFAESFYFVATQDLSTPEGIVAIPLEYDGLGLFVNDDIFSTFAATVPVSWDELRQTALALTVKDEQGVIRQAGVALGRTENVDHWQDILALMMIQNGVNMNNPRGELASEALRFFTRFSKEGIWDQTLPASTQAFAGGKVAMYFAPSWRVFEIQQLNPNLKFSVHTIPQLPKVSESDPDITYATYWAEGVWKRSESPEEAWKFLKFMSEKESLEKLFANASATRSFGEPYSRVDMAESIASNPFLGGIIEDARFAESWYLADRTFDGKTGINTQISGYFLDAIGAVNAGRDPLATMETAADGAQQVLAQYGVIAPLPPVTE